MAKKTKKQMIGDEIYCGVIETFHRHGFSGWGDVLAKYLTRAELERIAKKVRKDLGR